MIFKTIKMCAFLLCVVTPCILLGGYQSLWETFCVSHQRFNWLCTLPLRWPTWNTAVWDEAFHILSATAWRKIRRYDLCRLCVTVWTRSIKVLHKWTCLFEMFAAFRNNEAVNFPNYRVADKSLPRPTSRCILFDGENISFDASFIIYI